MAVGSPSPSLTMDHLGFYRSKAAFKERGSRSACDAWLRMMREQGKKKKVQQWLKHLVQI